MKWSRTWLAASWIGVLSGQLGFAQVTQRVSLSSAGVQGSYDSYTCTISEDGRYVAFSSNAVNLVPPDTNGPQVVDVYLRDRQTGTTERLSVDSNGTEANGRSIEPSISADNRYVLFKSSATNLVSPDTNPSYDVFLRDRQTGTTSLVNIASDGTQANAGAENASISANGRYVTFDSYSNNLVPGDTNSSKDIFVRDLVMGTTQRVSWRSNGTQVLGDSSDPSISADGRYIAFTSDDVFVVAPSSNSNDVYVRDLQTGTNERVSTTASGMDGAGPSGSPSISADGRYVAFETGEAQFVPGDTNGFADIIVRDRLNATMERVSKSSAGVQPNADCHNPKISADGRFVAFASTASNLVAGDTNGQQDVFVHDRQTGTTLRASVSSSGVQGSSPTYSPTISGDGRFVAFQTASPNLVPGDTNGWADIFVRDSLGGPAFLSLCHPGFDGVMQCPCSNPPSEPFRGCNNSSATGGAILTASGGTYLSSDSLVFTTLDEKPTALSLLSQWSSSVPAGAAFGQGVRCTSGVFKRLFSKSAVGGSIKVPDFAAGDPTVSARSAAKGDIILPAQSRWYLVSYRDNTVLGGCPPLTNFNATQAGQVTWSP